MTEKEQSENENNRKKLETALVSIFTVAAFSGLIAAAFYIFNFDGGLSDKPETWGQFGDYIGGVLNPFFALLGLLALLFTIVLQSKELELSRIELRNSSEALEGSRQIAEQQKELLFKQDQKSDIFRLLTFMFDELSGKLSEESTLKVLVNGKITNKTLNLEKFFGSEKSQTYFDVLPRAINGPENKAWRENSEVLSGFVSKLDEFADYLELFDGLSGDKNLTNYYRRRLYDVAWDLYSKEHMRVGTLDRFQPK